MKTILEFDLPRELELYKDHFYGPKYAKMWDKLGEWLRKKDKYTDEVSISVDELREKMNEIKVEVFSD